MLPLAKLETALKDCEREVYWRPVHAHGILAVPLVDEGFDGQTFVPAVGARHSYQAIVVSQKECDAVKERDVVCFDMGRSEEIVTLRGESFLYATEKNLSGVDDTFWPAQPTQRPSGLWVPG